MFKNNISVTNFGGTFCGTGITTIPVEIFSYAPDVTNFSQVFWKCNNLIDIPAGLFDNNRKVTNFSQALYEIPCIQESPYTIINVDGTDIKVHLYERANYKEHFTAPVIYKKCFSNNQNRADWTAIVAAGWN